MVKEKKLQIGDKEITMNLEELHTKPKKGDGQVSQVEKIMEQAEELPIEVQQLVFGALLTENAKYKE